MKEEQPVSNRSDHIPVLLEEVVRLLDPEAGQSYFDGTAGYGGHAQAISDRIGPSGQLYLVDRDQQAASHLQQQFPEASVINDDFLGAASQLVERGVTVDMALLDLGVSSPQLDQPKRGFSFRADAPLDMRMDQNQELTAEQVVNTTRESELADILYQYGEERRSRAVAKAIVAARPVTSTIQLAEIVAKVLGRGQKIHPATRTFQALRIYVNSELEQLQQVLPRLTTLLKPGGRLAVISFHSLEDRLVKEFINTETRDCICPPNQPVCTCDHVATLSKLTRKAISGTDDTFNPRARSAKLRAAVKLTPKLKELK